jgi:hypothetical protein
VCFLKVGCWAVGISFKPMHPLMWGPTRRLFERHGQRQGRCWMLLPCWWRTQWRSAWLPQLSGPMPGLLPGCVYANAGLALCTAARRLDAGHRQQPTKEASTAVTMPHLLPLIA